MIKILANKHYLRLSKLWITYFSKNQWKEHVYGIEEYATGIQVFYLKKLAK